MSQQQQQGTSFALLNKMLVLMVVVGLGAAGALLLRPEIKRQQTADAEIALLQEERDKARQVRDEHQRKLDWIRNDPEYLELVARDVLDLYRPGEVVLRLER